MSCVMTSEDIHFPASCIGVLADLWATDGVNQRDLGISLIKNKSSINKMLSALQADGMIIKQDDPSDKRGKLIYLTEKGKQMQSYIEQASRQLDEKLLSEVSEEDLKTTKRVLGRYYEMLLHDNTNQD